MNFFEALKNVDKTQDSLYIDPDELACAVGLQEFPDYVIYRNATEIFKKRIKIYPLTHYGNISETICAIFLDDELVASVQEKAFQFVSTKAYLDLQAFILECMNHGSVIPIIDREANIDDFYILEDNMEIITSLCTKAIYNNDEVTIINKPNYGYITIEY